MWSLGVLVYRLFTGRMPWDARNRKDLYTLLSDDTCYRETLDSMPITASEELRDFTRQLLQRDPQRRITSFQALSHPWLRRHRDEVDENSYLMYPQHRAASVTRDDHLMGLRQRLLTWPKLLERAEALQEEAEDTFESEEGVTSIYARLAKRGNPPSVLTPLLDVSASESSDATLSMRVLDLDQITSVEWFLNGKSLISSSPERRNVTLRRHEAHEDPSDGSVSLIIHQVSTYDAGTYSVVFTNSYGQTMDSTILRVTKNDVVSRRQRRSLTPAERPDFSAKFIASLIDVTAVATENVTIRALVGGIPRASCEWNLDGKQIFNSHRLRVSPLSENGWVSLEIRNLTEKDAGTYTLRATNRLGSQECSMFLSILPYGERHNMPRFKHQLHDSVRLVEGNPVKLTCQLSRPIGSSTPPVPKVKWLFNRQPLRSAQLLADDVWEQCVDQETYQCCLSALALSADQSGLYTCVVSNEHGSSLTESLVTVQSIRTRHGSVDRVLPYSISSGLTIRAPEFVQRLRHQQLTLEDEAIKSMDITLRCSAIGHPVPEVIWFKDGKPLQPGEKYTVRNLAGHFELRIHNPINDDIGQYEALAYNSGGECKCQCAITRYDDVDLLVPKFLRPLKSCGVKEGQPLEWSVLAKGNPVPNFHWEKDCLEILPDEPGEQHYILSEDGQGEGTLSIRHVRASDEGLYRVVASNRYGRSKNSAFLRVDKDQDLCERRSERSSNVRGLPPVSGGAITRRYARTVTEIEEESVEKIKSRTDVNVAPKPCVIAEIEVLDKPPRNIEVVEGEALELKFRIKLDGYYRANWTKRGRTLSYDQRHRISRDVATGEHQLSIDRCATMDSGKYTLEIESDMLKDMGEEGRIVLPVNVDVSPKPFERRRSSTASQEGPFTSARLSMSRSNTPTKQA